MKILNKLKELSVLTHIRMVMVLVLIIFVAVLMSGGKTSNADINTVAKAVTSAVDMSSMDEATNQTFKKFYGLNANDYEGVVYYSPKTNMDAQEILIVKLKDKSQAETVTAAINKRNETQKNIFEGYAPEQFSLLEKHMLNVSGNYILYIVHPDAAKGDTAFRDSL